MAHWAPEEAAHWTWSVLSPCPLPPTTLLNATETTIYFGRRLTLLPRCLRAARVVHEPPVATPCEQLAGTIMRQCPPIIEGLPRTADVVVTRAVGARLREVHELILARGGISPYRRIYSLETDSAMPTFVASTFIEWVN